VCGVLPFLGVGVCAEGGDGGGAEVGVEGLVGHCFFFCDCFCGVWLWYYKLT
jgi:hypothetical protein